MTTAPANDDVQPELIDGQPVTEHEIKITNVGDGLSDALALAPGTHLKIGDEVEVLVRGVVQPPAYKAVDKDALDGDLKRIDNVKGVSAKIVTGNPDVKQIMDEHDAAVAELRLQEREAKEGLTRLEFEDDDEQAAEDGVTDTVGLSSIDGDGEGGDGEGTGPEAVDG